MTDSRKIYFVSDSEYDEIYNTLLPHQRFISDRFPYENILLSGVPTTSDEAVVYDDDAQLEQRPLLDRLRKYVELGRPFGMFMNSDEWWQEEHGL